MFVCKICKEKYSSLEGLYSHLEEEHSAQIPPDMSTAHFYYYLKTGREHGNCVMCKQPTTFNEKTKKYNRFCNDPACKIKYKEIVDKRMIGVYGKVNLLNDPDHQRKMLMNRSISGVYNFKGVDKPYVGSYELDFLKTMDLFFDWDPSDIVSPSPHTYYYVYEGEKHFYIPDFYIMSLGLEIEVKDGGDNPNLHHKIQDVDKEKEKLKDKVMHTQKINHYIKLTNKNYYNLFEFFRISKEYVEKYGDYEKIPKIILDEDIKSKNISSSSKSKMNKEVNKAVNESYASDVDILKLNDYEPVTEKFNVTESYVCFPLLNSIISSKYDDVKSKEQYKRDVNAFKQHFLKGISRVDDIDDAKAMKGDLQALTSYLNGIKYTNNYSDFKNIYAVKEIEAWMCRVAIPELDLKINRYSKNLEPVNEYAHNITFAINNNLQRGIFGMMDDISSITIDDSIQLKRKNTVMQIITENLEYDDNTTIIKFGTNNDVSLSNDPNNNIGSYLNWNKNNGINALLKNVSDELFNSKISVEDFHKIEGGDE